MEIENPVVVYTAASNLEAYDVAEALGLVGISAHVVEDLPAIAAWVGGLNSVIHKPQVWVAKTDLEEARKTVLAFEDRQRARRAADLAKISRNQTVILATCERCGEESEFPVVQSGSVQSCPYCSAYLDVDIEPDSVEWDVGKPEPDPESRYYE